MRWLSQSEAAREVRVSRQAVSKLVKDGKLTRQDGRVDVDLLATMIKPKHAGLQIRVSAESKSETPPKVESLGSDTDGYWGAKTAKETAHAALAMIEVKEREGELIQADVAARIAAEAGMAFRASLNSLQAEFPDVVVGVFTRLMPDVAPDVLRAARHDVSVALGHALFASMDKAASVVDSLGDSLSASAT